MVSGASRKYFLAALRTRARSMAATSKLAMNSFCRSPAKAMCEPARLAAHGEARSVAQNLRRVRPLIAILGFPLCKVHPGERLDKGLLFPRILGPGLAPA